MLRGVRPISPRGIVDADARCTYIHIYVDRYMDTDVQIYIYSCIRNTYTGGAGFAPYRTEALQTLMHVMSQQDARDKYKESGTVRVCGCWFVCLSVSVPVCLFDCKKIMCAMSPHDVREKHK